METACSTAGEPRNETLGELVGARWRGVKAEVVPELLAEKASDIAWAVAAAEANHQRPVEAVVLVSREGGLGVVDPDRVPAVEEIPQFEPRLSAGEVLSDHATAWSVDLVVFLDAISRAAAARASHVDEGARLRSATSTSTSNASPSSLWST